MEDLICWYVCSFIKVKETDWQQYGEISLKNRHQDFDALTQNIEAIWIKCEESGYKSKKLVPAEPCSRFARALASAQPVLRARGAMTRCSTALERWCSRKTASGGRSQQRRLWAQRLWISIISNWHNLSSYSYLLCSCKFIIYLCRYSLKVSFKEICGAVNVNSIWCIFPSLWVNSLEILKGYHNFQSHFPFEDAMF